MNKNKTQNREVSKMIHRLNVIKKRKYSWLTGSVAVCFNFRKTRHREVLQWKHWIHDRVEIFRFHRRTRCLKKILLFKSIFGLQVTRKYSIFTSKQFRIRKFSIKLGVVILKVVKSTIYIASVLHQPKPLWSKLVLINCELLRYLKPS